MVAEIEFQIYPGFEECVTPHHLKRAIQNIPRHPQLLMVIAKPPSLLNLFTARKYPFLKPYDP